MSDVKPLPQTLEIKLTESEPIRVLLIEDNPGDARLVKEMLWEEGTNRFSLEHANCIREGLDLLSQKSYHIALLDLSLPDGQGLDTIRRVCPTTPHLPIIILTGLDDEMVAIQAMQEGVQDYLVKGQMNSYLITRSIRYAIERKRAEKEMIDLQDQLRQSQKIEAIGQLAGGIAHDFNNLLTVIKGYSELSLLELKAIDPLKGNIEEIKKAADRASDLTRQVLAFSRRQILDMKVLDLNSILKNLKKMLLRVIGEDIQLTTLLADDLGNIKGDPGQIEQVIMNLCVNARDAMPSGGKITIETTNVNLDETYAHAHISVIPGRYIMISISDTGIGMPPEVKEHIFEPFFTTKKEGRGTGLGLSTVYGIVKQTGGNIWVYSELGHGTTFKIYLPRVEEEAGFLDYQEIPFSPFQGTETVLLTEDDEAVRTYIRKVLEDHGYKTLEAANGEKALQIAQEHQGEIHLLLTDVVMPQIGGKELSERIKTLRPETKILFTSGYTDNAIVHHGVLDPGIDFLQKPFASATLAQKVHEVLNR